MGSIVLDSSVGVEEDFKDDKLDTLCVVSKVVTSVSTALTELRFELL